MSFESFVVNDIIRRNSRGPYLFKFNGQAHYQFGSLHPENCGDRSFAPLYIIDRVEATDTHISRNFTYDSNLMA